MISKRRLILVTSRFPLPLTSGFAIKNYWLIKGLSVHFSIDLFIIQRKKVTDEDRCEIEKYCNSVQIFKPRLIDYILGLIRSLVNDLPIQLSLFYSADARNHIRQALLSADLALSSVIRGYQYLEQYDGPIFCDLADSLGQLYLRDGNKFQGVKRFVYLEEGRRMLNYENSLVARSKRTFFFNVNEAAYFRPDKVAIVPHGVNPRLFEVNESSSQFSDGVVLFGKMNFEPNVQAAEWFVENILEKLPAHIRFYIIGADPCSRILKLQETNPRVIVTGYLSDPYIGIRSSIANVCPIQIGGGIQNKVIEGLAVGALTFVSPLAALPFQNIETSGLIVCATPEDWIRYITIASMQPDDFCCNRVKGREYARKYFSWDSYISSVVQSIESTNS
jgi:glycosyltransferase involved in cell wall biosynthesis